MKKCLSLLLLLAAVPVLGLSAWAESKEGETTSAESLAAAVLSDEGWGLLGLKGKAQPFFAEPTCDGPELALERFRRATDLDPQNAEAWHGLGLAQEKLGVCPSGYGGMLTWLQTAGLSYVDFNDPSLSWLAFDRTGDYFAAVAEATPKLRRAAELAPDDPEIQSDLAKNLVRQILGEKDAAARLRLADEALAIFDRSPSPGTGSYWSDWEVEITLVILRETDPAVWKTMLAGLLRMYDRRMEPAGAGEGGGSRIPGSAGRRERFLSLDVDQLLNAAGIPGDRLVRDKAEALLSAAHIRAARLASLDLEAENRAEEARTASASKTVTEPAPASGETEAVPAEKTATAAPASAETTAAEKTAPASGETAMSPEEKSRAQAVAAARSPEAVAARIQSRHLLYQGTLGRVELRQAAFEPDFTQWQAKMESAGRHYWEMINGLKKMDRPAVGQATYSAGHYGAIDEWIAAAGRETRNDRRQIMALGALDMLEDAVKFQEAAASGEADPDPEVDWWSSGRSPGQAYMYMMKVAGVMPDGDQRNELLARAERGFKELAEARRGRDRDFYNSVETKWAEALIELSRRESDPQRFRALVDQAEGLIRQNLDDNPRQPFWPSRKYTRLAMNYQNWIFQEKDPDHRRYLLEKGAANFEEAVRSQPNMMLYGTPGLLYGSVMGDMYFQLADLADKDEDRGRRRSWFNQAIQAYQRADEPRISDPSLPTFRNDTIFRLAQVNAHAYRNWGYEPKYLRLALDGWRELFSRLPEQAERHNITPRYAPDGRPDYSPETFQTYVTIQVAMRMLEINSVLDPDGGLDARGLTALAGLYRQLALSSVVIPEYQTLYLGRAEGLLRRAVERAVEEAAGVKPDSARPGSPGIPAATYTLGSSNRSGAASGTEASGPDRTGQALAMAELGLTLSEWTLMGGPCGEGGRVCLEEAEKFWQGAEELAGGSSRYARARWAAWLGDKEQVKTLVQHTVDETARDFFPSFFEASQDPAFDEIKNEAWFKKQWYGFVR